MTDTLGTMLLSIMAISGMHLFIYRVLLFLKFKNKNSTIQTYKVNEIVSGFTYNSMIGIISLMFVAFFGVTFLLINWFVIIPGLTGLAMVRYTERDNLENVDLNVYYKIIQLTWKKKCYLQHIDNIFKVVFGIATALVSIIYYKEIK